MPVNLLLNATFSVTSPVDVKRVLTRNTLWNYAGFGINVATNLVMFPLVVHSIGEAAAGVWLLLSSVTGYMGLLELGIVPSLTQTIAALRGRGDGHGVSQAASSSQAVLLVLGLVSLSISLGAGALVRSLNVPAHLESQAVLAFRIAIVGFALRMPLATYQGLLLGSQRQDRCSQLWIAVGATKFLGAAIVLGLGYGLLGLVATEMAVHLVAGILQVKWAFAEIPTLQLSWRLVTRADAFRLLSFGSALLSVAICSLVIEQTDRIVIAAFLSVQEVTHYAAAWKLCVLVYALTTIVVQPVSPLAAELHGRGDHKGLIDLFQRISKLALMIAWPFALSLAFAGGFLLHIWMGEAFVDSLPIVQVLLAGFLVTAHNHAGYSVLVGLRRVGPAVRRYFAPQAVLNLVLSLWLVHRLGSFGVALGTMVPALALEYFFLSYVLKELGVGWKEFFMRAPLPIGASALLAFWPLAITYTQVDPRSPVLPLTAAACTAIYMALVWRSLSSTEREDVLDYVPGFARQRARRLLVFAEALGTRSGENV
jgi:O-antigen/teichoic acid export membrane protein